MEKHFPRQFRHGQHGAALNIGALQACFSRFELQLSHLLKHGEVGTAWPGPGIVAAQVGLVGALAVHDRNAVALMPGIALALHPQPPL